MKKRTVFALAAGFAGSLALAGPASAQDTPPAPSVGETSRVAVVEGKVVRYEPGKRIVVLESGKEVAYPLSADIQVPADVQVGRTVSLSTQPGDGGVVVTRVTTTSSVTPEGNLKTETLTESSDGSSSKEVRVTGRVVAFEPGRSVTFVLPDDQTVMYTLDAASAVPADMAVGKTYVVETTRATDQGPLVVKKIVTTTTKKTTTIQ